MAEVKTKQDLAIEIVRKNESKSRKEVISIIMTDLKMSDAGASTYYYNAKQKIKAQAKTEGALSAMTDAGTTDAVATVEVPDGKKKAPGATVPANAGQLRTDLVVEGARQNELGHILPKITKTAKEVDAENKAGEKADAKKAAKEAAKESSEA